mmetsp:Transcript_83910/g.234218  ORF Transcript_83910/g.234218 Transcript_83910/m.234218 type:complete len:184 (-) Transcript_83910:285-836(-)
MRCGTWTTLGAFGPSANVRLPLALSRSSLSLGDLELGSDSLSTTSPSKQPGGVCDAKFEAARGRERGCRFGTARDVERPLDATLTLDTLDTLSGDASDKVVVVGVTASGIAATFVFFERAGQEPWNQQQTPAAQASPKTAASATRACTNPLLSLATTVGATSRGEVGRAELIDPPLSPRCLAK